MTTSFAVLADTITTRAWHDLTSHPNPNDAASALGQAARLLETLGRDPLSPGPGRPDRMARLRSADVLVLAGACRRAAAGPAISGRLTDLMAASADLVATLTPPPTAAERWAFTAAALDPILACTAVLREHSTNPAAVEVDSRLTRIRTLCEAAPTDPRDAARVDQTRPLTRPSTGAGHPRPERLIADLAYRAATTTTTDLSHTDARMLAAAGLHVALYARPIVTALTATHPSTPDGRAAEACDAMVARWFGVRAALRTTPDSTQQSVFAAQVADLATDLTATFGPPTAPDLTRAVTDPDRLATTYRGLVNHLPDLARTLTRAAAGWLPPDATDPDSTSAIAWRDRTGITHYATLAPSPVRPATSLAVAASALAAAHSSTVVAAAADRTAMRVGSQPHPHLAAAHRAATDHAPTVESRWQSVVDGIDPTLTEDPSWPALAHVLESAAAHGWNPATRLPRLARDLPDNQRVSELMYRVLAAAPIAVDDARHLSAPAPDSRANRLPFRTAAHLEPAHTPTPKAARPR